MDEERKLQSIPSRPHILMIVMDDLGSFDLGFHGSGILTPTSDALAKQGIYLDNYYVLPSCSPTRTALLSGRYPLHTGVHTWIEARSTGGLPLDEETLPQVLRRANYTAHAVGKWHAGHSSWNQTPTFRGFESFYGFYLGGQDYYSHLAPWYLPSATNLYDFRSDLQEYCGANCSRIVDERGNYSTHIFTREAINVIKRYSQSRRQQPLFLYLAFQAVHSPDQVPRYYLNLYDNKNWTMMRKTYAAMLTAADEGIANVTKALQATGLWNNTLVVFTTDNGGPTAACGIQGSLNYPKRGGKCSVWEGGTTGDGFLSGPALNSTARMVGNRRLVDLFHVVDWLPTLAEMVGVVPSGKRLDGVSQLTRLRATLNAHPARQEVYIGYAAANGLWYGPSVRHARWKLVQGASAGPYDPSIPALGGSPQPLVGGMMNSTYLLFDLYNDPGENHNVAAVYPQITNWLMSRLQVYQQTYVYQANNDNACPFNGTINSSVGLAWYVRNERDILAEIQHDILPPCSCVFFACVSGMSLSCAGFLGATVHLKLLSIHNRKSSSFVGRQRVLKLWGETT